MTNESDAKDDWINRVLGVVVVHPLDETSVRARLNAVGITLRNSKTIEGFRALADQMRQAVALLRNGDLTATMEQLDQIETRLSEQLSNVRASEQSGEGLSLRAVATASLEWRKLSADTARRVAELKNFILEAMLDDDDYDPDDIETVRGNLYRLDEVTVGMHETLADMMDELIKLPPQERLTYVETIRKALDQQEKFIASNEVVAAVDANEAVPISIAKLAGAAIGAMRSALP